MRNPRFWLILGALACAVHLWVNYPALPERVASHFGADGRADGWMSKSALAAFQLWLTGGLALLFLGLGSLIKALPPSTINVPNPGYWLAPSRQAATIGVIRSELARFGCALMVFFLGIQEATLRANIDQTFRLGPLFPLCMVAFLGFTMIWVVGFYRRFRV
jgi:uncharacterized membrane protein